MSQPPRARSGHLICGSGFKAVAVTAACAWFAWRSYGVLRDQDFLWDHQLWAVGTWAVWSLLLAGLFFETRCRRERILILLVLTNCLLGLIASASTSLAFETARHTRELSLALWLMAVLVSLSTIRIRLRRHEPPVK